MGYKSDTVIRMRLQEGMRLLFVGNLQAASHSLVRDVEEWIKMGVLDEQLKMKNKEDYIFFIAGTTVHFWFTDKKRKEEIKDKLSKIKELKLLDRRLMKKYKIPLLS